MHTLLKKAFNAGVKYGKEKNKINSFNYWYIKKGKKYIESFYENLVKCLE